MNSTNPFNFEEHAYPFDHNWNQFNDSIDNIFGQPLFENVLLDELENLALPCNNTSEFFTEVGEYEDVKLDSEFFVHCDVGSSHQVSSMLDEKPPRISNTVVSNGDNVVKMEIESAVSVPNLHHRRHSSSTSNVIRGSKRSVPLQLEEIRKYFHLPIKKVAKKMRVGLTHLKKRCRELNIVRWPCRKLKSLEALISNVKEMGLHEELVVLEMNKRLIEKLPDLELTDRTRKLRQACFKANYKKRKLLAGHSSLC